MVWSLIVMGLIIPYPKLYINHRGIFQHLEELACRQAATWAATSKIGQQILAPMLRECARSHHLANFAQHLQMR